MTTKKSLLSLIIVSTCVSSAFSQALSWNPSSDEILPAFLATHTDKIQYTAQVNNGQWVCVKTLSVYPESSLSDFVFNNLAYQLKWSGGVPTHIYSNLRNNATIFVNGNSTKYNAFSLHTKIVIQKIDKNNFISIS